MLAGKACCAWLRSRCAPLQRTMPARSSGSQAKAAPRGGGTHTAIHMPKGQGTDVLTAANAAVRFRRKALRFNPNGASARFRRSLQRKQAGQPCETVPPCGLIHTPVGDARFDPENLSDAELATVLRLVFLALIFTAVGYWLIHHRGIHEDTVVPTLIAGFVVSVLFGWVWPLLFRLFGGGRPSGPSDRDDAPRSKR